MKSTLEQLITARSRFRFYDRDVVIQSDSCSTVDLFRQLYDRFTVDGLVPFSQSPAEFTILSEANNPWGKPVLILEGEVWQLEPSQPLEGFIYGNILNAIIAGVRTHFLIHAGVVAAPGHGIILSGDSGHGKTTLVLELVRRGLMFLSDELAAIGRQDHQVYPFPRSLRVRSSTLALTDLSRSAANAPVWLDKMIVDIEQVRQGSLGTAVPIGKVVILHDAKMTGEDNASVAGGKRMLGILVDRLDDDLVASIERIEGVSDVSVDDERGFPMIRLWASRRTDALLRVEALCQRRQILVLDVIKREQKAATFAGRARLEHIPKSQATLELLRRFQGGHKSALLKDEFDGSATRLFMELGVVLSQADCFRLYVGSLNEMADLVCDLVETR